MNLKFYPLTSVNRPNNAQFLPHREHNVFPLRASHCYETHASKSSVCNDVTRSLFYLRRDVTNCRLPTAIRDMQFVTDKATAHARKICHGTLTLCSWRTAG
jgi:hypothetical protein